MKISRRSALGMMAAAPVLRNAAAQQPTLDIHKGRFAGTRESLKSYVVPEWFRDAKFGIWAHWGPQSAPEQGDWYARRMYMESEPAYKWHQQNFGHQSRVGFKDVIATFKGEKFDPEHLVELYQKAGAKYFVSMGVHHDNFDMWNSKRRWNAVKMGPRKDVVGLFRQAALKRGLKFGVSDHLWISYKWFGPSHDSDKAGQYAGLGYDGNDPANFDLYHDLAKDYPSKLAWDETGIPEPWKREWFDRIKELVDNYRPDFLYSDGNIQFQDYGLSMVAHLYNTNPQAVFTSKRREDCEQGTCTLDFERGLPDGIHPNPWQTDTCVGDWHYKRDIRYKTPKIVIDMLVDVVSRNGNLLLNFPLPGSGELDSRELAIVGEITTWMGVNGEAIYGTRPWRSFGEGPSASQKGGAFNERGRNALTAADIRFTIKGKTLYVFVMGWPGAVAVVPSLAKDKIANVSMLGVKGSLQWSQDEGGLKVQLPPEKPADHAVALKIALG